MPSKDDNAEELLIRNIRKLLIKIKELLRKKQIKGEGVDSTEKSK